MTIASKLTQLAEIKADIKQAINDKGQTVGDNMTTYAEAIGSIESLEKVTISGSNVPVNEKVFIGFDTSKNAQIVSSDNNYTYSGISMGGGVFKTSLPDPLPYQQNYTVNGTVTINNSYQGTGWSSNNYITSITINEEKNIEFICKCYFSSTSSVRSLGNLVGVSNKTIFLHSGTAYERAGTYDSSPSTGNIWVRVRIINGIAIGWWLPDNNYTESSLPDIDSWQRGFVGNKSTNSFTVTIGRTMGSNGANWSGNIYLDCCKIYELDIENNTKTLIWQLLSPFSLVKPDITKYIPSGDWDIKKGQGTPSDATHVLGFRFGVYGFKYDSSNLSYPCAKTFRWNLANATSAYVKGHFKTGSSWAGSSIMEPILAYTTNSYSSPIYIYIANDDRRLTGFGGTIISSCSTKTEYWFEVELKADGTRTVKTSTDGTNWTTTTETVTAPSWSDYTDIPCLGYWGNANFYFNGTIYDFECGYTDTETHTFKLWK